MRCEEVILIFFSFFLLIPTFVSLSYLPYIEKEISPVPG